MNLDKPEVLAPALECDNMLILVIETIDGRKKLGKWLKGLDIVESFDKLSTWPKKRQPLVSQIRSRAQDLGLDLHSHTIDYLIDANGSDIGRQQRSLELIKIYFGDKTPELYKISELVPNLAQTSYDLALTMTEFPEKVYGMAQKVLELGYHPLQVLATVVNRIQKQMIAAIGKEAGLDRGVIAELNGIPDNGYNYYLIASTKFVSAEQLVIAYEALNELIHRFKRGLKASPVKVA